MFRRVLIANRGEIALRILRSLRSLGVEAVVTHGRDDRLTLPVRLADEGVFISRDDPLASYLDIEAVVSAAKEVGADAVHPGYGFLAENPALAERLAEEDIAFICEAEAIIFPYAAKVEVERVLEVGHPLADAGEKDSPAFFRGDAAYLLDPVLRNGGDAAADELELVAIDAFFNRCAHQDALVRLDDLFQGGSLTWISRLHLLQKNDSGL